jgi:hypothetical protein
LAKSLRARLEDLDAALGGGASEAEISAAQEALGVELPADFKNFLAEVGWVEVGDLSIAGLGQGVPEDLDLVPIARAAWEAKIPGDLLPVADDGGGDFLFLELAGGRMVYLANSVREELAPSFSVWLEEELAGFEEEE